MAESSPFPDQEGEELKRSTSSLEEVVIAALLFLTSTSPEIIRRHILNNTLSDYVTDVLDRFDTNLRKTLPTLLSTSQYGFNRALSELDLPLEGVVNEDDLIELLDEHLRYIANSTESAVSQVTIEDEEAQLVLLPYVIGLNANQSRKLVNYYNASQGKRELAAIEATLSRMRDEALSYRANLIAVSLAEDALEQGKLVAAGRIQSGVSYPILKTWNCSFINSCQVCIGLHGETVLFDAPFSNGMYRPKAHSNCSCALTISRGI